MDRDTLPRHAPRLLPAHRSRASDFGCASDNPRPPAQPPTAPDFRDTTRPSTARLPRFVPAIPRNEPAPAAIAAAQPDLRRSRFHAPSPPAALLKIHPRARPFQSPIEAPSNPSAPLPSAAYFQD